MAKGDKDQELRKRLYHVLGKPKSAALQRLDKEGQWGYSGTLKLDASDFYAHLKGKSTRALSCVAKSDIGPHALFLCWDIDKDFEQRLPILHAVLSRRKFARACFATTGSDAGRGKVVLTLAQPIPQAYASDLVKRIFEEAREDAFWGDGSVDLFPFGTDGGKVRVLGRNQSRAADGHLDVALDLSGDPSNLNYLIPHYLGDQIVPSYVSQGPLQYHQCVYDGTIQNSEADSTGGMKVKADAICSQPYQGGGFSIFADMRLLARDAIRLHGKEERGRAFFEFRCQCLQSLIPPDRSQTLRQIRNQKTRNRVWVKACAYMTSGAGEGYGVFHDLLKGWKPLTPETLPVQGFEHFRRPNTAAWRAYSAVAEFVTKKGLNPHGFGMAYSTWATLAGYANKSAASLAADEAEKAGLLFRTDRGQGKVGGLVTLVSLVGIGETPQTAYDVAIKSEKYLERLADRKAKGLEPFHGRVENGRLVFPKKAVPTPLTKLPARIYAPAYVQPAA